MFDKEKLEAAGMDYNTGVKRFGGNDELYQTYLKNFIQDPYFLQTKEAVEKREYKDALFATHALKGVSGTLGFVQLFDFTSMLVEVLRKEQFEMVEPLFEQVEKEYEEIMNLLTV